MGRVNQRESNPFLRYTVKSRTNLTQPIKHQVAI